MTNKFYVVKGDCNKEGLYNTLYSKDSDGYFHMAFDDRKCDCINRELEVVVIEIPASDYELIDPEPDCMNTQLLNEMKKQALYESVLEDT